MFGAGSPWRPRCMSSSPTQSEYMRMHARYINFVLHESSPALVSFYLRGVRWKMHSARRFAAGGKGQTGVFCFIAHPRQVHEKTRSAALKKNGCWVLAASARDSFWACAKCHQCAFYRRADINYVSGVVSEIRYNWMALVYKKFRKCINLLPSAAFGIFPKHITELLLSVIIFIQL